MQLFRTDRPLTDSWNLVQPSINLVKENIWQVFILYFLPNLLSTVGLVMSGLVTSTAEHPWHYDGHQSTTIGLMLIAIGTIWTLLALP